MSLYIWLYDNFRLLLFLRRLLRFFRRWRLCCCCVSDVKWRLTHNVADASFYTAQTTFFSFALLPSMMSPMTSIPAFAQNLFADSFCVLTPSSDEHRHRVAAALATVVDCVETLPGVATEPFSLHNCGA